MRAGVVRRRRPLQEVRHQAHLAFRALWAGPGPFTRNEAHKIALDVMGFSPERGFVTEKLTLREARDFVRRLIVLGLA